MARVPYAREKHTMELIGHLGADTAGTHVARSARMRERPSTLATSTIKPLGSADSTPPSPSSLVEQGNPDHAAELPELDKYDISTLACTD